MLSLQASVTTSVPLLASASSLGLRRVSLNTIAATRSAPSGPCRSPSASWAPPRRLRRRHGRESTGQIAWPPTLCRNPPVIITYPLYSLHLPCCPEPGLPCTHSLPPVHPLRSRCPPTVLPLSTPAPIQTYVPLPDKHMSRLDTSCILFIWFIHLVFVGFPPVVRRDGFTFSSRPRAVRGMGVRVRLLSHRPVLLPIFLLMHISA